MVTWMFVFRSTVLSEKGSMTNSSTLSACNALGGNSVEAGEGMTSE